MAAGTEALIGSSASVALTGTSASVPLTSTTQADNLAAADSSGPAPSQAFAGLLQTARARGAPAADPKSDARARKQAAVPSATSADDAVGQITQCLGAFPTSAMAPFNTDPPPASSANAAASAMSPIDIVNGAAPQTTSAEAGSTETLETAAATPASATPGANPPGHGTVRSAAPAGAGPQANALSPDASSSAVLAAEAESLPEEAPGAASTGDAPTDTRLAPAREGDSESDDASMSAQSGTLSATARESRDSSDASPTAGGSDGSPSAHIARSDPQSPSPSLDPTTLGSMAAHWSASSHRAADGTAANVELRAPVGTAAWNEELGVHLTLMTREGSDSASLKVTPEGLGPIEVRIDLHGTNANVWFGAAHEDTRTALEQSLPRLRELFANQGLSLGDSGVFREPPRQQASTPLATRFASAAPAMPAAPVTSVTPARVGLVDLYA